MGNLEKFFNYLLSSEIKGDLRLVKDYPNYEEVVKDYKTKYEKISLMPKNDQYNKLSKIYKGNSIEDDQIYKIPFYLFNKGVYELKIDIDLIKILTKNYNNLNFEKNECKEEYRCLPIGPIYINADYIELDLPIQIAQKILFENGIDYINKEYAIYCAKNDEPILCADFTGIIENDIPLKIIDGNHRTYGKIFTGEKKIKCIIVSRNIWIKCLYTLEDEIFFKIYHNINLILNYRMGLISEDQVKKLMYTI